MEDISQGPTPEGEAPAPGGAGEPPGEAAPEDHGGPAREARDELQPAEEPPPPEAPENNQGQPHTPPDAVEEPADDQGYGKVRLRKKQPRDAIYQRPDRKTTDLLDDARDAPGMPSSGSGPAPAVTPASPSDGPNRDSVACEHAVQTGPATYRVGAPAPRGVGPGAQRDQPGPTGGTTDEGATGEKRPISRQVTPEGGTSAEKHQRTDHVGYIMDEEDDDVHPVFLSEKQATKRKEVYPWRMDKDDQQKFKQAREKEWGNIRKARAVTILSPEEAQVIRKQMPDRILGSRHCYSWKPTDEDQIAKCRWVALGHQHPGLAKLMTYAPMVTKESWMLAMQYLASGGFEMELGDISSAFMNGLPYLFEGGHLYCELPPDGVPDVEPGSLIQLDVAVYGLPEAPQWWHKSFDMVANEAGFRQSTFDPCLYSITSSCKGETKLHGVLALAVDDTCGGATRSGRRQWRSSRRGSRSANGGKGRGPSADAIASRKRTGESRSTRRTSRSRAP